MVQVFITSFFNMFYSSWFSARLVSLMQFTHRLTENQSDCKTRINHDNARRKEESNKFRHHNGWIDSVTTKSSSF